MLNLSQRYRAQFPNWYCPGYLQGSETCSFGIRREGNVSIAMESSIDGVRSAVDPSKKGRVGLQQLHKGLRGHSVISRVCKE